MAVGLGAAVSATATAEPPSLGKVAATGMTISTDTRTCALGAVGTIGGIVSGAQYGVTAAHCFEDGKPVYGGSKQKPWLLGHYEKAVGTDASPAELGFALIRLEPDVFMRAFLPDDTVINTADTVPSIGQDVCHIGYGTGWNCGTVTTVADTYFKTNFPSDHGDSGGVVYHKSSGKTVDFLGILIGCTDDGQALIETATHLQSLISAHAGGQFDWYTE
ncbi:trypsin-like serine protease [Nocardia tengchongensis]|uniref:trypsin-like serine protease n=1 Tax=Nocardia tengchongensis TaxID=2055889 RepID=UPI00365A4D60